ncbi:hypothetical protein [Paenibacillus sp. DYY-L-2]|uniref:hypothetical protein n=1 Tax=Paenibacillus sp. DYY-L-2 TaxID=3447013 RepID=UPI003F505C3E
MLLYIGIFLLAIVAAAGTIMVGNSKENRTENPDYDRRSKKNVTKLILMYAGSIFAIALLIMGILD